MSLHWNWDKESFKRLYQSLTRGWNDSDCWNLDVTIAKFIIPRLKRFKEIKYEYPAEFIINDRYTWNTEASAINKWNEILDKMILAFDLEIKKCNGEKVDEEKIKEGLELFAKYYSKLWD